MPVHQNNRTNITTFPLSKIHRLLRPLKSSIITLKQSIEIYQNKIIKQNQIKNHLLNHSIFKEKKSLKRKKDEDDEFIPYKKKFKSSNLLHRSNNLIKTNQLSSPLFDRSDSSNNNHNKKKGFYGSHRRTIRRLHEPSKYHHHNLNHIEIKVEEIEMKIEKVIIAYKNILESVNEIDYSKRTKLTICCARVIGKSLENLIRTQINDQNDDDDDDDDQNETTCLVEEENWKTSEMDEWYDAIPVLYRRYALAQHALSLILIDFPINNGQTQISISKNKKKSFTYKLFDNLNKLHRSYTSTNLITSQVLTLLPYLFNLNSPNWSNLYETCFFQFNLSEDFNELFYNKLKNKSFLNYWSNWNLGLIEFIDSHTYNFITKSIEKWLEERENFIIERNRKLIAQEVGLESEEEEDLQINSFDQRTSHIILQWLDSLIQTCLPNSIYCIQSRKKLNEISRLVYESIESYQHLNSNNDSDCFLDMLCIAIESHRFTLYNLSIFEPTIPSPTLIPSNNNNNNNFVNKYEPIRLLNILRIIKNKPLNQYDKILNKSSKVFLRSHRATRLLAVLGGNNNNLIISGLSDLLKKLKNYSTSTFELNINLLDLGKSWLQTLLRTDPISWWNDGDEIERREIRIWLEDWLGKLSDQGNLSLTDEDEDEDEVIEDLSLTIGRRSSKLSKNINEVEGMNVLAGLEDDDEEESEGTGTVEKGFLGSQMSVKDSDDDDDDERYGPSKRYRHRGQQDRHCTCGGSTLDSSVPAIGTENDEKPDLRKRRPTPPTTSAHTRREMWISSRVEQFPPVNRVSQTPTPITQSTSKMDWQIPNQRFASTISSSSTSQNASTLTSSERRTSSSISSLINQNFKGKQKEKVLVEDEFDDDEFDLLSRNRSVTPWPMRKKTFEGGSKKIKKS
ncbi:hypothetical protein CROQUDRAFT_725676 [Cronartium quercuum f. sp. fusiforme G11]|uniref:Uncharacterized protein n=1 Tax=Cronartium quercuum f. sp. fusiforme G11 TaxID=708437 RepID=A0A9P6T7B9_9BASI|nr:hypothetical protein CROQUDRAFT_725676 [Cronartium quercuum f. sp. fusiforme G11]